MNDAEDPEKLAEDLSEEADGLAHRSEALQADIDRTRQEWEVKREDGSVPGAVPAHLDSPGPDDPAAFPGKS